MKLTDFEFNVSEIINVRKGTIPISTPFCSSRHSDCFVYVLSGSAEYTFGEKTFIAEKGNIIYLSHGSKYDIKVSETGYWFIHVDFFFENDSVEICENKIFKHESLAELESTFVKMRKCWLDGSVSDKIKCKSYLYSIYSEVVEAELWGYAPSSKISKLKKAVKMISEGYSNPNFSVEQLCKECGLSEVHFRRLFWEVYHTSPIKYIISLRVNRAKELLLGTDMSMRDISDGCGFNSAYYFSKMFKESTGMTPSSYRAISLKL